MEIALVASAALLGLAGSPHCAAMCSAPCAAAMGPQRGGTGAVAFHGARVLGYALGGAVASSSVAALAAWAAWSPAVRPLWTLLHVAALGLGLVLLVRGRQPAWMAGLGRSSVSAAAPAGWQRMRGPVRAAATGGLWVAWPCGLLQSALLVSAMTSHAATGAAAMAAFAVASAPGLVLGPWAFRFLARGADPCARERLATRAAGGLLVAASGFALGHGLWEQVAAFCATAVSGGPV